MQNKSKKQVLDVQKESLVQAVIIADSYNDNFLPVTDSPCLMPLVNRTLLEYTLWCLANSKVQETIIFCTSNIEQIKELVNARDNRWGKMLVNVVVSDGCSSLGDAMRDIDGKGLIRGDFILLTGDVVGNLQLIPALERHKEIRKTEAGAVMTLVYKECGKKTRSGDDQVLLAIDSNCGRVLLHQKNMQQKKFNILMEILLEQSDVDVRTDLLDTKICICSDAVPPLFSDNFDFQNRDDFVKGLLMNEEILAATIYSYILPKNEYAASVTSWQNYHYISHDILHRWTFPLVPDCAPDDTYSYKVNNVYLQDNVSLSKNCNLQEDVVVGKGSVLNENVKVTSSVIGRNCQIGANVTISNSHIFSNVKIEDDCVINYCVLSEGAVLKSKSNVKYCILGPGVEVEPEKNLENMRLQKTPSAGESHGPKAYEFKEEKDDSDSDSEKPGDEWKGLSIIKTAQFDSDDESIDSDDMLSEHGSTIPDDTNLFYSEVIDSLLRGYEEGLPCDNLVLEINSSRYAYNVTVNEVNYYVSKAILTIKDDFKWDIILDKIKYFMPLFTNYMKNESAMADCLSAIEDVAEMNPVFRNDVMKLLNFLYQKDILSEDSILKWYQNPKTGADSEIEIRQKIVPFIKWLEEAEESDSN